MLDAQDLGLGYGREQVAGPITLSLAKPGFTVLLGPNGCGKSTLLKGLGGILAPQSGEIRLDGKPLADWGAKPLARRLASLPQTPQAPEGTTVEALVRMGRHPHRTLFRPWSVRDEAASEGALRRCGLEALRHRPLEALSGGQRQRAWIAMVLAQDSEILLLDEPTTWLDLAHQVEVLELLRDLADEGRQVIAVLHDLHLAARHADRLVLMKAGRIAADGPPEAVLEPERIEEVFGLRVRVIADPETGRPLAIPRRARR